MNQKFRHQGIKMFSVAIAMAVLAAVYGGPTANAADNPFAGKTLWVVDVNTNEDYNNQLLEAVEKLLPQYAPGVKVQRVKTGSKNPFFLLKEENYPAAVIAGTGVCVATTPQAINYAASALKLGIPTVILHIPEMKETREKFVKSYRVPDLPFHEVAEGAPETAEEADRLAKAAVPALVKALAEQVKK